MAYIVCAYYTVKTPYEEEVKNLEASLKKHHLPYDLVGIPNQGGFQANTQYKAYFIKQMMIRHYPLDILYLDADARVQQYPSLFDTFKGDVGVFYLDSHYAGTDHHELISSTLYFANTPKAMEIVERWIAQQFDYPLIWDQKILQYVVEHSEDLNLQLVRLPPTYCQIFDLMKDWGVPVIEQFQASRRFRDLV